MKNLTSIAVHSDWLFNQHMRIDEKWDFHRNRVNFGKLSLEKWMFIPCDENGVIFDEPERIHFSTEFDYKAELSVYQEAKGRCLFEGFIFRAENEKSFTVELNGETFWIEKNETIEDLLGFNHEFELTKTAKNQIGP